MTHQPAIQNSKLREQERRALLSYAFFRWESAATLALTLILAIFVPDPFRGALPFWGWWMWIVLGLLAEALIVGTTLTDGDARARIASQLFRERLHLDEIADVDLRQQLVKVLDTRAQMEVVIQRSRGKASAPSLLAVGDEVSNWIEGMYRLARRLDEVRDRADLFRRQAALSAGRSPAKRGLSAGAQPFTERLDRAAERASAQFDASSSTLEAIYTEMQLGAAGGADSRRLRRLRDEIAGHAQSLSELDGEIAASFEQIAERSGP